MVTNGRIGGGSGAADERQDGKSPNGETSFHAIENRNMRRDFVAFPGSWKARFSVCAGIGGMNLGGKFTGH
ncbi:hypothetical protein SBV1_1480043 [Verrucomicrobia bacterium]|nr:hypothetical protein SBV1_1480043 [Verrucomicrobiota bacterium]